ncbi:hypothetical protein [Aquimarina sp. Aq78]|uniref:hypothetical protein n=1 Tax=Aquimarina sp. Aq78 TaxID=1191889 RepID=UPI000D0F991B|nr:hypothetical protein [Aquimarina sp. Aq78]
MELDLEKGLSLKIEGELGKNQTLSVDSLIKIAQSLQELVISIAKYDLPIDEAIDLNNFKIELTDFKKGSAIPTFALTQKVFPVTTSDYLQQRKEVGKKLNSLLSITDKGSYNDLKEFYPEQIKRNELVDKLYNFTTSFKNSPVYIYEKGNINEGYKPKKFKSSIKKNLLVKVQEIKEEKNVENAFATIKIITKGNKKQNRIQEVILPTHNSLSYSPDIINVNNKQYIFNYPLRCLFEKEDDYYLINNELLDIVGTGMTQDEAEENFNEEFDYLFNRLNSLSEDKLSKHLNRIKGFINSYVKEVL